MRQCDHGRFMAARRPTNAFRHGDVMPWHLFDLSGEYGLVDSEHCGYDQPRFSDLAWIYSKIATRCKQPIVANQLLTRFIEKSGVPRDEFERVFLPVISTKAIFLLRDSLLDRDALDYTQEARRLFEQCLQQNIDQFLIENP